MLTNLLGKKPEELVANIAVYRKAGPTPATTGAGIVTLMLHTFVGPDGDAVRRRFAPRSWSTSRPRPISLPRCDGS